MLVTRAIRKSISIIFSQYFYKCGWFFLKVVLLSVDVIFLHFLSAGKFDINDSMTHISVYTQGRPVNIIAKIEIR